MDRKASDNEYFHQGFHKSLNVGVDYVAETYGKEAMIDYLTRYTKVVQKPVIEAVKKEGLSALNTKILNTYKTEKVPEAVSTVLDGDTLTVTVSACPAVAYMHSADVPVSKWFRYTTETVMGVIAEETGYRFTMESYDDETGAAKYSFCK